MRRVLGCGQTAVTGTSIQDGTWVSPTIGGEKQRTVLSILTMGMDMDMGGMTNPATQNKDLFAAKQFVQVRK